MVINVLLIFSYEKITILLYPHCFVFLNYSTKLLKIDYKVKLAHFYHVDDRLFIRKYVRTLLRKSV